jgi:hypothetical protein
MNQSINQSIRIKTEESRVAKKAWAKFESTTVNLFTLLKKQLLEKGLQLAWIKLTGGVVDTTAVSRSPFFYSVSALG